VRACVRAFAVSFSLCLSLLPLSLFLSLSLSLFLSLPLSLSLSLSLQGVKAPGTPWVFDICVEHLSSEIAVGHAGVDEGARAPGLRGAASACGGHISARGHAFARAHLRPARWRKSANESRDDEGGSACENNGVCRGGCKRKMQGVACTRSKSVRRPGFISMHRPLQPRQMSRKAVFDSRYGSYAPTSTYVPT